MATIRMSGRRGARALVVLGAAGAALLGWVVAVPVAGIDLVADTGGGATQRVGAVSVVLAGLLVGLAGWGLLAVLERFTARGRLIWTVLAVLVLLVSLAGPLGGATAAARLTLAGMHVLVGVILISLLARTSRAAGGP